MRTLTPEAIVLALVFGVGLGVIFILILEYICRKLEYLMIEAIVLRFPDEPFTRVRTPHSTDEESLPSRSQCFGDVAEVHPADESSVASSLKEGGPASSTPHWKEVTSSQKRGQASSSSERSRAPSSRERSRVSSSRERSRVTLSQKRSNGPSSRKRQSKSCSPDKIFERSPEPSVRIRRSTGIAAGPSSQPQPIPPTLFTEVGAYGIFDRSQEVPALSPSASRSSHSSSVTRPSRVCMVTPSTSLRSSPSSQPRPIRASAPLREPQTPSPTAPSRTSIPTELPQVPSSSESSRRGVPERVSRISASAGSSRPPGRSLEEQLRSPLSGGLQSKSPLSPRASAKVKDETPTTPAKLHGGDSDEKSEDDEDAL